MRVSGFLRPFWHYARSFWFSGMHCNLEHTFKHNVTLAKALVLLEERPFSTHGIKQTRACFDYCLEWNKNEPAQLQKIEEIRKQ